MTDPEGGGREVQSPLGFDVPGRRPRLEDRQHRPRRGSRRYRPSGAAGPPACGLSPSQTNRLGTTGRGMRPASDWRVSVLFHHPTLRPAAARDTAEEHRSLIAADAVIMSDEIAANPTPHNAPSGERPRVAQGKCHDRSTGSPPLKSTHYDLRSDIEGAEIQAIHRQVSLRPDGRVEILLSAQVERQVPSRSLRIREVRSRLRK